MNFPPESFVELRELVGMIREGEIDLTLGKKLFRALEVMLEQPDIIALNNIVELSLKVKISTASISRLSKLLGFKGFKQFQLLFKQKSKMANSFYSDGIKRLLNQPQLSAKQLLQQQSLVIADNIEQALSHIDNDSLDKAQALLARKNRIHIFAYRHSAAVANILRYGLALIRPNVQMLVQEAHGVAIALGQLKKEDLLVVIGSSPYSDVTVKIASIAKKQHCQTLVITDSHHSPLNELATVKLTMPPAKHFYTNSLVNNCFLIEGLLSLTALSLGNTAVNHALHHEVLLSQLGES